MACTRSRSFISGAPARLLPALLLLAPAASPGADRGGVESPFALGAGARPLALGGAYVAVAEGPAALAWNVAGLSSGEKKEVTFFYTSPYVEGNHYSFVGYAHPLLNFGTLGFGNLRYGMDDIAKYDGTGEPLGSFSSVQNEWIVAYALPHVGPFAAGASVKAETQTLDGHSATGIGADVGLLAGGEGEPAEALSMRNLAFGLAIRNVLEPTLHLADGEDRLPTLLRAGLAYALPLGGLPGRSLLLAVGFDQGTRSGGHVRFGSECALAGGLALRAGWNNGRASTGFGLRLGGGRFDYAFDSGALGTAHRLGITFAFGRGLDALREERRIREEERLEEKTRVELARKERSQFEAHLADGNARFAAGDWSEAGTAYERALLWNPESAEATERLAAARAEGWIARGDRHRGAGDLLEAMADYQAALAIRPDDERADSLAREVRGKLERSAALDRETSGKLTGGIESLALSDFASARRAFTEALRIDPANEDARRFLARTDSLIALRVDALVEEGNWLRDRGESGRAMERYTEAITLRPDRDDLAREIARLEAPAPEIPGEETAAAETDEAPPREPTAEELREAEGMYRSGLDAFTAGRYPEAARYFEFVYGLAPGYENVHSYVKQAHLFLGMDLYTEGKLAEAVRSWERILEIDPGDEKALSYVRRARAEMRKTRGMSAGGGE